jgi:hypothetical protein
MLNKTIRSLALLSLFLTARGSFSQNRNWKTVGAFQRLSPGSAYVPTRGIHVDSAGNVYVAGYVLGDVEAGRFSWGSYDAFVPKYDSAGIKLWGRQFGSATAISPGP